jgi:hypothetical protein
LSFEQFAVNEQLSKIFIFSSTTRISRIGEILVFNPKVLSPATEEIASLVPNYLTVLPLQAIEPLG